ncbi:MAG: virulence protein SciE type [Rhodocyclaceae bacterium]|nr:virulence protein SciE type [Rhodocyclaceae bacterium]
MQTGMTLKATMPAGAPLATLIEQTMAQVRKEPRAVHHRVLLFQLFSLTGQLDRAVNQLAVLADIDKENEEMARAYREVLRCEAYRRKVFQGEKTPLVLGEPIDWFAQLVEALRANAMGQHEQAAQLRAQAFDAAPTTGGSADGTPFTWIADADQRFGPVLEALINGKYYWVPFERLASIELEAPVDLRDLVWLPATLTFTTGATQVAFIPARYPDSETSADDEIRLARRTDWQDVGFDTYFGSGQRMLATDAGEFGLFDLRRITLQAAV